MSLTEEEARIYQQTLEVAQRQLQEIDEQIEEELAKTRERLSVLQDRRTAAAQMCDAVRGMLGIPTEQETAEDDAVENSER